jgi:hypothetical protein
VRSIAMALVGATMVFGDYVEDALGRTPSDAAKNTANTIKLAWFIATLICIIGGW